MLQMQGGTGNGPALFILGQDASAAMEGIELTGLPATLIDK
jgi:hypothetical protein